MAAAIVAVQTPGCSCRAETAAEKAARIAKEEAERIAEEKRKEEEERRRRPIDLSAFPKTLPAGSGPVSLLVKPGHWNAIEQPAKANAEDFDGVLTYEVVPGENAPGPPPALRLLSRRPLVVARESEKVVDALFYCPPVARGAPKLQSTVRARRSGELVQDLPISLRPMLDHQYHFVVLAKEPERYAFLDALYSVTAPLPPTIDTSAAKPTPNALDAEKNYRVVAVPIDEPAGVSLPDNPLAWTSIAYLLWDEVDPESLRADQRDALVDWINWGGQLIVNGPDSLDLLRGSFLEPLLPATSGGAREIPADELQSLAQRWQTGQKGRDLATDGTWTGVRLRPAKGSFGMPGAVDLLVERPVGRGRVVVSGMQLADRRLVAWSRGVDNLYNAAILRRPPRRFVAGGSSPSGDGERLTASVEWAPPLEPLRLDPLLNTRQRSFVRDAHSDLDALRLRFSSTGVTAGGGAPGGRGGAYGGPVVVGVRPGRAVASAPAGDEWLSLAPAVVAGGAGAMNDFNLAASAARGRLRDSAGVSVPGSGFVIACLAAYLFFLAPVNWAFFAALRRVELAWVAAPVIALVGAWVVIQQARLDIGFVRSRVEVGVLELQPDTPRGLLSRFTALYTSLSTTYDMEFDGAAVAAPFARDEAPTGPAIGAAPAVAYERLEKTRLKDIAVSSATTELIRSEEVLDVGAQGVPGSSTPGSIHLEAGPNGEPRLVNRTGWLLEDVMLVERRDGPRGEPRLAGCWIGDMAPEAIFNVVYLPIPDAPANPSDQAPLPFAEQRDAAQKVRRSGEQEPMRLDELTRLALVPSWYEPGERRVIARVSGVMPGLRIEPAASQLSGATLVVAHLKYGDLPVPRNDVNGPLDIQ